VATFGQWLRHILDDMGIRPSQLAKYTDYSRASVSRWLNDVFVPDPEACVRIAQVLHLPLSDVLRAAGHPVPDAPASTDVPPEISPAVRRFIPVLETFDEGELRALERSIQGLLEMREYRARYEAGKPPDQDTPPAS
jgi:transcriptional regulator with XRE-family HTH domain